MNSICQLQCCHFCWVALSKPILAGIKQLIILQIFIKLIENYFSNTFDIDDRRDIGL